MTIDEQMNQETAPMLESSEQQTPSQTWQERFMQFVSRGKFDDLDENITKPNFRFNIMGVDCVPSGEITAISGKPGAGKSTALAILVGVLIGRSVFAGIRCVTPCKKVLWIDTEKGEYTCQKKMSVFRRVANVGQSQSLEDVGVDFYLMRQETTEDRLHFIDALSQLEHYDAIVIDGIFDLTNDPDKNYAPVIDLLRKLADGGASVFAMLHTNKGDDNMRYALGTELQRICTTRLTIEYDSKTGQHRIKHDKSNDSALAHEVAFVFDECGNVIPADESPQVQAKLQSSLNELRQTFVDVFDDSQTMTHTEMKKRLKEMGMSESTANRRIGEGKSKGIISLIPNGKVYQLTGI